MNEDNLKEAKEQYPWLPIGYTEREAYKQHPGWGAAEHLLYVMQSHFARSLEAMGYDTMRHVGWHEYAAAYLWEESQAEVPIADEDSMAVVIDLLGIVPAPLPNFRTRYWQDKNGRSAPGLH